MQELQIQLKQTKDSFNKLRDNFQNNIKVIEQLEHENNLLQNELQKSMAENQNTNNEFRQNLRDREQEEQISYLKRDFEFRSKEMAVEYERETEHLVEIINDKMRAEMAFIQKQHSRDTEQLKSMMAKTESSQKSLVSQNQKLLQTVRQLKFQKQTLQEQTRQLKQYRQTMLNKYELYQQQLQGMRNSNQEWQQILKSKNKDLQREKQDLQVEMGELKLQFKEKLRRLKQQQGKKVVQIAEAKEDVVRGILQDSKEIRFKFQGLLSENQERKREVQRKDIAIKSFEEKLRVLEREKEKNRQNQYLKKMHQQEKSYLQTEIESLSSSNKDLKEELQQTDQKREQSDLKLQRLKAIHMTKLEELKKLQEDLKQIRKKQRNQQSKFQQLQQSRLFSEDQGGYDDMFWEQSQKVPQGNLQGSPKSKGPNQAHRLMKKIGQLQVENESLKNSVKIMSEQLQRIRGSFEDKMDLRDRQIRLSREETHILREKVNDKESQLLGQKQGNASLRLDVQTLIKFKERCEAMEKQIQENSELLKRCEKEGKGYQEGFLKMKGEVDNLTEERDALEEISSELKAEINDLRDQLRQCSEIGEEFAENNGEQEQESYINLHERRQLPQDHRNPQFSQVEQREQHPRNISYPERERQIPFANHNRPTPQAQQNPRKGPRKLYDLIKEKKKLEMVGMKANVQQKAYQQIISHTGTNSQKEMYRGLKEKSKTPPKRLANFNAMRIANEQIS